MAVSFSAAASGTPRAPKSNENENKTVSESSALRVASLTDKKKCYEHVLIIPQVPEGINHNTKNIKEWSESLPAPTASRGGFAWQSILHRARTILNKTVRVCACVCGAAHGLDNCKFLV